MERGKKIDWPGAVMGRDRKMMRVGERGDLDRLGQTAGPDQIDHGDVGGLLLQNFEEGRLGNQSFADALRDPRFANEALLVARAMALAQPALMKKPVGGRFAEVRADAANGFATNPNHLLEERF